jgi:hypothetical protein
MPENGDMGRQKSTGKPLMYMDGGWRVVNEGGLAIMGGGYFKNAQGTQFRQGPQGGFPEVGGPSRTMVEKYAATASGLNDSLEQVDALDKGLRAVKRTGPLGFLTNGNDLVEAEQLAEMAQLLLKENPYNLGVITGPDRMILQRIVSDPSSLKDAMFRKSVTPRLRNIAAQLGRKYRNSGESFRAVGGNPNALPNLFQAADSQYTPQEWGRRGLVPRLKSGQDSLVARGTQGGGRPATRPVFQGRGGAILEVIED